MTDAPFPLTPELRDSLALDSLRVQRLDSRVRGELADRRCGVCFSALEVSGDRVPFVRYTCTHGPKDRGASYLQAAA